MTQSESGAFDWDIALDLGDQSGAQGLPDDDEGRQIVRQFEALKRHRREDICSVCGNHDRSGLLEAQAWYWRNWLDPTGENTSHSRVDAARRRYPVRSTWERYSFPVAAIVRVRR